MTSLPKLRVALEMSFAIKCLFVNFQVVYFIYMAAFQCKTTVNFHIRLFVIRTFNKLSENQRIFVKLKLYQ